MKKRIPFIVLLFLTCFFTILMFFQFSCIKESPSESQVCEMVGGSEMPPIKCSSGTYDKTLSNITWSSMRVASYDYSLTCDGKTYSGSVNNLNRTITVNGTECNF
jgi:hypothetical protein